MTPQEVLDKVLAAGGRVILEPERPRLLVPADLKPLVAEHREAIRHIILTEAQASAGLANPQPPSPTPIPTLRQKLRQWYAMVVREADGYPPIPEEARTLLSEIRRLWDDTGPSFAEAVHEQESRTYYRQTRRCPTCGEPGVFHDPDRGGEAAT